MVSTAEMKFTSTVVGVVGVVGADDRERSRAAATCPSDTIPPCCTPKFCTVTCMCMQAQPCHVLVVLTESLVSSRTS